MKVTSTHLEDEEVQAEEQERNDAVGPLTLVPTDDTRRLYSSRSIPINALMSSLPSDQSLADATPSSFHSTLFFQNWLLPTTSTTSMDQPPAFLSSQPFHYSHYGSLGSSSYFAPSYASSYFDHNHVDVIMDDGTRQKRTISLSTVPRFPSFPSILSPRGVNEMTHLLQQSPDQQRHDYHSTTKANQHHYAQNRDEDEDEDDDDDGDNDAFINNKYDATTTRTAVTSITAWYLSIKKCLTLSLEQQRVLKCSLAYTLGSLFTFIPLLHQWINGGEEGVARNQVASHMAATVTVFFNPAKTVGGMVEAAGIGWSSVLAASAICLASLGTTDYFLDDLHQPYVSYTITLVGWLFTSTLFFTYLKVYYSNRPSVATASALAFIILFPILVREHSLDESQYSRQKIQDTFLIVAIGTAISAATCFFIWPQTATKKFNTNMNNSLQSFRILLKLLTKTFLLDADLPDFKANEALTDAIKAHTSSFTALQSSLQEARLEWWWWCKSNDGADGSDEYERMVKSIQRLALHIGGLRKSCGLQFDRTQQSPAAPAATSAARDEKVAYQVRADDQRRKFERTLRREQSSNAGDLADTNEGSSTTKDKNNASGSDNDGSLTSFLRTVGPSMKSLAFTCKQTIMHLQWHFTPHSASSYPPPPFSTLRQNLGLALDVFEQSQQKALTRLYQSRANNKKKCPAKADHSNIAPSPSVVHTELLAHFPADDLFLVYFFVFCLIAFAKELMVLVSCMEHVFDRSRNLISLTSLVFGIKFFFTAAFQSSHDASFLPNNHHTLDTLHTPTPNNLIHSFRLSLWSFFSWFRKYQVRYALKSGLTALALASLAFFPSTQYYFQTYRMEWTLITALAVMTPTVGGTNFIAVLRLGATVLGCVLGAFVYQVFSDYHVTVLIFITWLVSLPCFWAILYQPKYGKFGQFTLLAYTLVVLYKYNHPDVNIFDLAYQRCVAVCLGVLIGLVVTIYMWPYEARKEVRFGLSDLLLRFSWQYYQLHDNSSSNHAIASVSKTITIEQTTDNTALLDLQQHLYHLTALLSHTPNEPRLKGKFPVKSYQAMLQSCQSILDNLVMMRMLTNQQVKNNQILQGDWTEMVGNVVLYFYVLASALLLKTPLPPYLPPADMARKQLIGRLQSTLASSSSSLAATSTHAMHHADGFSSSYMAYYAYIILMESMLYDMDQLGSHMKALYGSLIPHWQV